MDTTLFPLICLADIPPERIDHFLLESHDAAERLVSGIAPCFRLINGRADDETDAPALTLPPQKPAAQPSSSSSSGGWSLPWPFGAAPPKPGAEPEQRVVNLDAEPTCPPVHPFLSPYEGKDLGTAALQLAGTCVPTAPSLFVAMDEESVHFDTVEVVHVQLERHTVDHVRVSFRNAQKVLEQLRFGTLSLGEMKAYAAEHGGVYGRKVRA